MVSARKIKNAIFYFAYFLWIIYNVIYASTLPIRTGIPSIITRIVVVLLVVSFLINLQIGKKELLIYSILVMIIYISGTLGNSNSLLIGMIFILASKDVDKEQIYSIAIYAYIIGIFFVVLLAVSGIISNNITMRGDGTIRVPMGFSHVNTFGAYILMASTLWLYKKYNVMHWRVYFFLIAIIAFLTFFVDSRSPMVVLSIALILSIVLRKKPEIRFPKIFDYIYVILALASFIIAKFYCSSNPIWVLLNELVTNRLQYLHDFYLKYGFSIFGQPVYLLSSIDSQLGLGQAAMLDNGYGHIAIRYGVVLLLLLLFEWTWLLKYARRTDNKALYIILIVFSLYTFMEASTTTLVYNPWILLFSMPITEMKKNYGD